MTFWQTFWEWLNTMSPPPPTIPVIPPAPPPAPIPPLPPPPPLVPYVPGQVQSDFQNCVRLVLEHEGGNDDDPRDPGGRTSRGIIQSEWNTWRKSHPGLPGDVWSAPQVQVEAIYREKYWDALGCDRMPSGVDYAMFDFGVNSGISRAQKFRDGISALKPTDIIDELCSARLTFLKGLTTWKTFGRGWTTRVNDVRRDAIAMARGAAVELPKVLPAPSEKLTLGQRVKTAMLLAGNPWFDDQNVVSIEGMDPDGTVNDNRPNGFDDIKMVLNGDGKIIGGPWEGTTQPGMYWTQHPMASGGAFIIALGPQACWTPGDRPGRRRHHHGHPRSRRHLSASGAAYQARRYRHPPSWWL